ncbi:hypothetical protein [Microbispora sp. NPDC049125]
MSVEELMQSLIQSMFGVFGAPDDPEVAKHADDVLADLHTALAGG